MGQAQPDKSRIHDPGFGEEIGGKSRRLINKDGSFNVRRRGGGVGMRNVYQYLLDLSNLKFFLLILIGYVVLSLLFALLYFSIGSNHLIGVHGETLMGSFMDCFYFSTQTFTTVGYGAIAPSGAATSAVASFEAFTGLIFFAIATGLLFARFSKPRAILRYSANAVIAPYEDGEALMFRFANARNNVLMEIHARTIVVMRSATDDALHRRYFGLKLEIDSITFLPLSWTLVHKIDDSSPMKGLTLSEMKDLDFEILILITAFDDTFHQTIHSRHSYVADEMVWGAKFIRAFSPNSRGAITLDLDALDEIEMIK